MSVAPQPPVGGWVKSLVTGPSLLAISISKTSFTKNFKFIKIHVHANFMNSKCNVVTKRVFFHIEVEVNKLVIMF